MNQTETPTYSTEIFILRHGECEGGNILRGHTDVALSDLGYEQMSNTINNAVALHGLHFNAVYSSSLQRCSLFSQAISKKDDIPLKESDALKEINFGNWDGQQISELYLHSKSEIEGYWADPWSITPPNGESMFDFENRINDFWSQILKQHAGQKLLLVTHAGVIRHLMAKALGISKAVGFYTQLSLPYAALVKITVFHSPEGNFTKLHWS